MTTRPAPRLSLGPVLFNWSPEIWRDSYFRIADEAPVDAVHLGEVVCSKREPFFESVLPDVVDRLTAAGKTVILSTLALVTSPQERARIQVTASDDTWAIEANDLATAALLAGRPHVVGPFVSTYNEGTLDYLAAKGATRVCLPSELSGEALACLASHRDQSTFPGLELEVQAFGRLPLALSSRCYHARSRGLHKDGCQYVCGEDPDGMAVSTLDDQDFLAVNGTQTMSFRHLALLPELGDLARMGIDWFRLWPHRCDMVRVAQLYRDVLDGRKGSQDAMAELEELLPEAQFANGYFHGRTGHEWVEGTV